MHGHLQLLLSHYGYFGIFIVLLLEMIGIPFPAETTLVLSGAEWTKGIFSLFPLLCFAVLGNTIGSTIAYCIGRFLGHTVLLRFGRFIGITEQRLQKAEAAFQKYGPPIVLFSKFIAGIRVLVPYLAGINRMSFGVFIVLNSISAIVWTSLFIVLGKYIATSWHYIHHFLHPFYWPLTLLIIFGAILYLIRRTKRSKVQKQAKLAFNEFESNKDC